MNVERDRGREGEDVSKIAKSVGKEICEDTTGDSITISMGHANSGIHRTNTKAQ